LEYVGLNEINGSLVVLDGVIDPAYDEIVSFAVEGGQRRTGRVVEIDGDKAVVLVFEGTGSLSLENTVARFTGKPMEMRLSEEILGRTFDGMGRPLDGMGEVFADCVREIRGRAINPVMRLYPRDYIQTGISSIDGLCTLIRGQKLPIFSGSGLPHDRLAAQIASQASISGEDGKNFAVVFAAMGVKHDVAEFFRKSFEENGARERAVMFLNLANDPVMERVNTPMAALTAAEYLAFERGMHILVILTDMTAYAEALREISSMRGEIPSRKGYPGYLYSEFASVYERAGIVEGRKGSVTQIPILTMPNDDITHPVPDLTGYITEGQIVLDRGLSQRGVYPPVSILPSLSRLMKDGIGEGFTRTDHPEQANQLFSSYSRVEEARALASVIGEEELAEIDKQFIAFGKAFEERYLNQSAYENRAICETLDLGWELLGMLPKSQLDRIDPRTLEKFYSAKKAVRA